MVTEPYLDLTNAKRHREQNRSQTDAFYDQQARAVSQWGLAKPKPAGVRVGELPTPYCNAKLPQLSELGNYLR